MGAFLAEKEEDVAVIQLNGEYPEGKPALNRLLGIA